jgi:hypothetical protein
MDATTIDMTRELATAYFWMFGLFVLSAGAIAAPPLFKALHRLLTRHPSRVFRSANQGVR